MTAAELPLREETAAGRRVWRIGYKPTPWAWVGWEWADGGRFNGRWDDANGNFRTIYAGGSLTACLFELLASFRPDPFVVEGLDDIVEEDQDQDQVLHPSVGPGRVPYSWLEPRTAATAVLSGTYCAVTDSKTLAFLRPLFIAEAIRLGLNDLDAAALKDPRARSLTQRVSSFVYDTTDADGIRFRSRHGDDLELWAVFERPDDEDISARLSGIRNHPLDPDGPEIAEVFSILGLEWADQ